MKFNYKNKNCIVTGASGFIGQALTDELIKHEANVFVIDNFSYGSNRKDINANAKIFQGDVRDYTNFTSLPRINYDYLFHFAAPSSITLFNKNPIECFDITLNGFLNAVKFSVTHNIRLIYPSTGSLYSGTTPPQSESSILMINSLNSYARAKLSLELIHESTKNLNAIGLRIFAGYGTQESHKGDFASVIYLFCKEMINGRSPVLFGDGTQKRDFIYIDDLVTAILIIGQNANEQIINIGSGKNISFNKIVEIINSKIEKEVLPRYVEMPNLYLEKTMADRKTMEKYYIIKTDIEEGVSKVIKSIKE